MSYPVRPGDAGDDRVRLDPARYWAGAGATALVAALIALVGILISRWTLGIPILAPSHEGAWGNAHTAEYVLAAVLITAVAAGLLYLLVLAAPQPRLFFGWIVGLATLAAVVYPFSTSAPLDQKVATAVVNLVLGLAIATLLSASAARAVRHRVLRTAPPYEGSRPNYVPDPRYDPEQDPRYGRDPHYAHDARYDRGQQDPRYAQGQQQHDPRYTTHRDFRQDQDYRQGQRYGQDERYQPYDERYQQGRQPDPNATRTRPTRQPGPPPDHGGEPRDWN